MRILKILVISLFALTSTTAYADWVADVEDKAEELLEPVVADLGAAISGGLYGNACTIGFPGIEAGLMVSAAGISDDNSIIPGKYIPAPWLAGRIGLPKNIAIFVRGLNYAVGDSDEKINLFGAGAKYSMVKEKTTPPIPNVAVLLGYNKLEVLDVKVGVFSIGCVISKKLPVISPYAGISFEMITSEIGTLTGTVKPSKNLFRFGGGVDFKPFPFVFINGGVDYINSNLGWNIGLGLRFAV